MALQPHWHRNTANASRRQYIPMGLPSGPTAAPAPFLLSRLLKKLARTPVSLVDVFSLLASACIDQPALLRQTGIPGQPGLPITQFPFYFLGRVSATDANCCDWWPHNVVVCLSVVHLCHATKVERIKDTSGCTLGDPRHNPRITRGSDVCIYETAFTTLHKHLTTPGKVVSIQVGIPNIRRWSKYYEQKFSTARILCCQIMQITVVWNESGLSYKTETSSALHHNVTKLWNSDKKNYVVHLTQCPLVRRRFTAAPEALGYGTCCRGISQFYLCTHAFIHERNEPYPASRSWSSFMNPGGMEGWVGADITTVSKQYAQECYATAVTVVQTIMSHWTTGD